LVSSVIIIPQLQHDGTSWALLGFCIDVAGDDSGALLVMLRFELKLFGGGICTFPLTMTMVMT